MMLISVIIPNYNHASYLRQRIDSVLSQTYADIEVILLDDCSTDNSREVLETYRQHPKVAQIVYNETNSGSLFRQWEKGIGLARGEFVWIAESDDYADPQLLESLVAPLAADPALGLAYCDSRIVFADGRRDPKTFADYRNRQLHSHKWEGDYCNNGRQEIEENLLDWCTINNASAVLFRKEALLAVAPFDLDLRYTGDWYAYLKLCLRYDLCYVHRPLNHYREHAANSFKKSRDGVAYVREYFLVFDWIYRHIDFVPRKKILKLFLHHTRHTLIRNWNKGRIRLYQQLYRRNKALFRAMLLHNTIAPFRERIGIR